MIVTDIPPNVLWAQRTDKVMISIQLGDVTDEHISIDEHCLKFDGKSGGKQYAVQLELNKDILPNESKQKKGGREYYFELKKKDQTGPFWPRLLKDSKKHGNIKIDFNRWKDEDDESDEDGNKYDDASLEDMMKQMGTGGGGGGDFDPGSSSEDSDDDDLPELEGESNGA